MSDIFVLHRPYGDYPKVAPGVYVCRKCGRRVIIRESSGPAARLAPCVKCGGIQYAPLMSIAEPEGAHK